MMVLMGLILATFVCMHGMNPVRQMWSQRGSEMDGPTEGGLLRLSFFIIRW